MRLLLRSKELRDRENPSQVLLPERDFLSSVIGLVNLFEDAVAQFEGGTMSDYNKKVEHLLAYIRKKK